MSDSDVKSPLVLTPTFTRNYFPASLPSAAKAKVCSDKEGMAWVKRRVGALASPLLI